MQIDLSLKGNPAEIPHASRDDLPQLFVDRGYKVGAEIGVYEGEFSEKLCKAGLKIFAIDPWEGNTPHFSNKLNYRKQYRKAYDVAKQRLEPYGCTLIKKTSMEAVEDFEDNSLDFVYIDGNHSFRYVAEDLHEWSRKVKPGGIVAGHDYYVSSIRKHDYSVHVMPVVDAFVRAFDIKEFYVLGERFAPDRDKWRSWFFIWR